LQVVRTGPFPTRPCPASVFLRAFVEKSTAVSWVKVSARPREHRTPDLTLIYFDNIINWLRRVGYVQANNGSYRWLPAC
jgi:hypothetical protein